MAGQTPLLVPQFGIFAQGTSAHVFLEFDLRREVVTAAAAIAWFRRLRSPRCLPAG